MKIDASQTPTLEAMAADTSRIDRAQVAREFESLLFAQVWKGALAPTGASKLLDGGSAGKMYREMFIDEVVRRMPASGGFGLAERLITQLETPVPAPEGERDDG